MFEANSGYTTMPCPEKPRSRDIGLGGGTCVGIKLWGPLLAQQSSPLPLLPLPPSLFNIFSQQSSL